MQRYFLTQRSRLSSLGVRNISSYFKHPIEARFAPVQAYDDKFNSSFDNMTFNLNGQVQIRFKPDTTLNYFHQALLHSEDNNVK